MNVDEFRQYQQDQEIRYLDSLVRSCRRRYLNASRLLQLFSPTIESLDEFGVYASINVWALRRPFRVLAERYVEEFFFSQLSLFPALQMQEDAKWTRYFYRVLEPQLLRDDEVVRNVLRAVEAIPSQMPHQAVVSLTQHFGEMVLPRKWLDLPAEDAAEFL